MSETEVHQAVPGIGDCGRAGVGYQRNFGALLKLDNQFRCLSDFIVFVEEGLSAF